MSHITTIKTELRDGQILKKTLLKLGYHVVEGGMISGGYGRDRSDVEILATTRAQTIGFRRSSADAGLYEILADWNDNRNRQRELVSDIFQIYSQEKVVKAARLRGYSIIRNQRNQKGQVEMVLRKVA